MVWQIEFTKKAQKQLYQLDQTAQSKIKKTVYEKLLVAPKENLIRLSGNLNVFTNLELANIAYYVLNNNF